MNGALPAISVVIPALNAGPTLGAQLDALAAQAIDRPWEVVVVDNGSTDDTAAVARGWRHHPRCEVRVVSERRRGLNAARNAGVQASTAPIVAICDADDVVAPGWLAALTGALGHADIVCGWLDVRSINTADAIALRGWSDVAGPFPSIGRELGHLDQVLCGNVAFARDVWVQLGGFDETFARGGDDVDFGWRAQMRGFSVASCEGAVLHYRARGDTRSMFRQYVRDGEGAAHLYQRHASTGMPARRPLEALRVMGWLARHLITLRRHDREMAGHLLRVAGKQWGRIKGSVRHRVVYL